MPIEFVNLTSQKIEVYSQIQFTDLVKVNETSYTATGVNGSPILSLESSGKAWISVSTTPAPSIGLVPLFKTEYGDLTGFPSDTKDKLFIVPLPVKSNATLNKHKISNQLVSPINVVRLVSDTSVVLGCFGLSY